MHYFFMNILKLAVSTICTVSTHQTPAFVILLCWNFTSLLSNFCWWGCKVWFYLLLRGWPHYVTKTQTTGFCKVCYNIIKCLSNQTLPHAITKRWRNRRKCFSSNSLFTVKRLQEFRKGGLGRKSLNNPTWRPGPSPRPPWPRGFWMPWGSGGKATSQRRPLTLFDNITLNFVKLNLIIYLLNINPLNSNIDNSYLNLTQLNFVR